MDRGAVNTSGRFIVSQSGGTSHRDSTTKNQGDLFFACLAPHVLTHTGGVPQMRLIRTPDLNMVPTQFLLISLLPTQRGEKRRMGPESSTSTSALLGELFCAVSLVESLCSNALGTISRAICLV